MPKREINQSKFPRSFDEVPFTLKDIKEYKSKYIGSKLERHDIKKAYLKYKGCLTHMAAEILFMDHTSESRVKNVINRMIRSGEIPFYNTYIQDELTHNAGENQCREMVCYKEGPKDGDRLSRGVVSLLKKFKPYKQKKRIPRKYLRPKAMKAIAAANHTADNQNSFKSTVSFVGEIVKGLFK